MNNEEFVRAFESLELPSGSFRHRDHIRLAWHYLQQDTLTVALERFVTGLRRFAEHHGASTLYHETITFAFLFLIHERMARAASNDSWEGFAAANEDLFAWNPSILDLLYRRETLASDLARRTFLLPDKISPMGEPLLSFSSEVVGGLTE